MADLGIEVGRLTGRGQAEGGLTGGAGSGAMVPLRELTEGELVELAQADLGVRPAARKAMRHQHHLLARLLAEGKRPEAASAITGYAPSTIAILQGDPAFQELLAYYGGQVEVAYVNVHERLAALGITSLEVLQERLEANPDGFSNKELRELMMALMDRSVAPPKGAAGAGAAGGSPVSVTINFKRPEGLLLEASAVLEGEGQG